MKTDLSLMLLLGVLGVFLPNASSQVVSEPSFEFDFQDTPFFISPSPSSNQIAVVSKHGGSLFVLERREWVGPMVFNVGYLGDKRTSTATGGMKTWPYYYWFRDDDGTEVFVANKNSNRGIMRDGSKVVSTHYPRPENIQYIEPQTGRLRNFYHETDHEGVSLVKILERVGLFLEKGANAIGRKALLQAPLPSSIYSLIDISPHRNGILCRVSANDPLVLLNLKTGESASFRVHGHPRILKDGMTGSFSPDGNYVLMNYRYDPDDHYQGGHLQVFSVDGRFVDEVTTSDKWPINEAYWLHNNWIVYGIGQKVYFKKFVSP